MELVYCSMKRSVGKLNLKDDYTIYMAINSLKTQRKFKCKRCDCKSERLPFEGHKFLSRVCRKCGYEESPIVNTMFEGSHIPPSQYFKILFAIRKHVIKFFKQKYKLDSIEEFSWRDDYRFFKKRSTMQARKSIAELSNELGIAENTVSLVLKRIYKWMPKKERDRIDIQYVFPEYFKRLKSLDEMLFYLAIFNFIFYSYKFYDEDDKILEVLYKIVPDAMMLEMAVKKKSYYNELK